MEKSASPDLDTQKKHKLPILMMGISVLAASTGAIFIRLAQGDVPSLVIAAYRLSIASIVLAPIALIRYRKEVFSVSGKQFIMLAASGLFLALHFGSWITSLRFTSVASSAVLVAMSPLLVAVLSTIFLNEPLSRTGWIGMFVALVGSMLIGTGGDFFSGVGKEITMTGFVGNLLAFLGAVFIAGYLIIGRSLRKSMSLVPYAFIVFSIAAVFLVLASIISGYSMTGFPVGNYLWLFGLALIPQIMGHAVFNWSLKYLSASFVSIALLGEPIGSTVLAFFLLGESPTWVEIVGGLMILGGIYLASVRKD